MSNGYAPGDYTIAQTVGASQTDQVVSKIYPITAGGSIHHAVVLDVSAVTAATGITAKLQTGIGSTWQDSKTVAITGNGRFYIKLLAEAAGDQTYLPLLRNGRVVITTGAGDSVTVDAVNVLQAL